MSVTVDGQTTQFVYNGDGAMVKMIHPNGNYVEYAGSVYEVARDAEDVVTQTTVYYPAGGAMRVDGALYYVIKDHLGSASLTLDNSGAVAGRQTYAAFGGTRTSTGDMVTDRLYTGQRALEELGIYYYNARWYDPYLKRWLQPDTIIPENSDSQSFDRYSYVRNDPANFSDPSGHYDVPGDDGADYISGVKDESVVQTIILISNGNPAIEWIPMESQLLESLVGYTPPEPVNYPSYTHEVMTHTSTVLQDAAFKMSSVGATIEIAGFLSAGPKGFAIAHGIYSKTFGVFETYLSWGSTGLTVIDSLFSGATALSTSGIVVDESTATSFIGSVAGGITQSGVVDAVIDGYMCKYNYDELPQRFHLYYFLMISE